MTSKASGDFSVTISTRASWSMVHERSTSLPSTLPASAALARPAPMDAATSRTLGGASKDLVLLSGSVMVIMAIGGGNQESASGPRDLGRGTGDRGPGTGDQKRNNPLSSFRTGRETSEPGIHVDLERNGFRP